MDAGQGAENELTTEECLDLVVEMRALGTEMLILTGGEPLLRRDIYQIASRASELGMWVVMGTNGVLVNDHVAKKMVECGVKGVGISIDSVDPCKHNAFRGGPDAWKYSVRALEICRKHGLEVLVQSTVMRDNLEEVPDLMAFARDKGAWSFNLYYLVETGRGREMAEQELSAAQTDASLRELVDAQHEYAPMLVRAKCAPQFKQLAFEMGRGGMESGGCMAGTEYCRITPEGNVTPCPYMDLVAGNVRDQGFTAVWDTSSVLLDLRDTARLKGKCGSCEFSELCGGCRCRAYAASGDHLAQDPACMYQPGSMERPEIPDVAFSDPVIRRIDRIPIAFIREKVRRGLIAYASRHHLSVVTTADMDAAIAGSGRAMPAWGQS
ncbi:MAG: radical SAM protein [Rhodothermales bacterium]|nr:radical SAM protein [Rhodothermales bacterium]MBO6778135.1 radical SAM protein [Rhodothermales bacterium]